MKWIWEEGPPSLKLCHHFIHSLTHSFDNPLMLDYLSAPAWTQAAPVNSFRACNPTCWLYPCEKHCRPLPESRICISYTLLMSLSRFAHIAFTSSKRSLRISLHKFETSHLRRLFPQCFVTFRLLIIEFMINYTLFYCPLSDLKQRNSQVHVT